MDSHLNPTHATEVGNNYYRQLYRARKAIDFISVQYFNGITRPNLPEVGYKGEDCTRCKTSVQKLHKHIVDHFFDGAASKVLFGMCISCAKQDSTMSPQQAVSVMKELQHDYPDNGGMSYWAAGFDEDLAFSSALHEYLNPLRSAHPSAAPSTSSPPPATSSPPTSVPASPAPVGSYDRTWTGGKYVNGVWRAYCRCKLVSWLHN
eukprot:Sspe_Gene.62068::Locus_34643_Transcript_1_1_Confidence_1.000_Length_1791::g.62068::m.62068